MRERGGWGPNGCPAGEGPVMAACRVNSRNPEVRGTGTFHPSGVTALHCCSPCGLFVPLSM